MIRKIQIERFSLTTSKPFDEVVAGLNAGIGHPDMAEFGRSTHDPRSFAELKSAVEKGLSKVGLMLFMQLDQGAVMRKELGRDVPKIVRLIIGNPLIMKEMAKHVPDAGSYAPVTVLVDERADGVHLSYDRMTSLLARMRIAKRWRWPGIGKSKICNDMLLRARRPRNGQTESQIATDDYAADIHPAPKRPHITTLARATGLEPAACCVTGRPSNQLNYARTVYQTNKALFSTDTKAHLGESARAGRRAI
jgi:uncharacterized protein (DUF302 family)